MPRIATTPPDASDVEDDDLNFLQLGDLEGEWQNGTVPQAAALVSTEAATADGDEDNDEDEEDKPCSGCSVMSKSGFCWEDPSNRPTWALPHYRGLWCKACFCCWRLRYRGDITLTHLHSWLQTTNNRTEFRLTLLAWMTLKREGKERARKQDLLIRVDSIRWMCKTMGWPIGPFVIRMLSKELGDSASIDPRRLVTVGGEDTLHLGYMLEEDPAGAGKLVTRPAFESNGFLGTATLRTTQDEDLDTIKGAFPRGCCRYGRRFVIRVGLNGHRAAGLAHDLSFEGRQLFQHDRAEMAH
jgi:hypothetical protein